MAFARKIKAQIVQKPRFHRLECWILHAGRPGEATDCHPGAYLPPAAGGATDPLHRTQTGLPRAHPAPVTASQPEVAGLSQMTRAPTLPATVRR